MNEQDKISEINKAIAEALDYYVIQDYSGGGYKLYHPSKYIRCPWRDSYEEAWTDVDDYFNDLNACHEMEKVIDQLPLDVKSLWYDYLGLIVGWRNEKESNEARFVCNYNSARATAPQRCEAFLRTVGKWKEDYK